MVPDNVMSMHRRIRLIFFLVCSLSTVEGGGGGELAYRKDGGAFPEGGGTPLYGLYRYVRPQRSFCTLALIWVIFFRRSHFFIIIKKKINKSPSQIMLTVI